jgi:hypothetical protein
MKFLTKLLKFNLMIEFLTGIQSLQGNPWPRTAEMMACMETEEAFSTIGH